MEFIFYFEKDGVIKSDKAKAVRPTYEVRDEIESIVQKYASEMDSLTKEEKAANESGSQAAVLKIGQQSREIVRRMNTEIIKAAYSVDAMAPYPQEQWKKDVDSREWKIQDVAEVEKAVEQFRKALGA